MDSHIYDTRKILALLQTRQTTHLLTRCWLDALIPGHALCLFCVGLSSYLRPWPKEIETRLEAAPDLATAFQARSGKGRYSWICPQIESVSPIPYTVTHCTL